MRFPYLLGHAARMATCLLALSVVPALGCGGDDDDDDHDHDAASEESAHAPGEHDEKDVGPPSGATCPDDDSALTYEAFGKPFMEEYCVKCHSTENKTEASRMGAPEGHDFDVFEGILGVANHIDQKAAAGPDSVNTAMPPKTEKQPSMEERELLGQWIACELEKAEQ